MTTQKVLETSTLTLQGSMTKLKTTAIHGSISPVDKSPKDGDSNVVVIHEKVELDLLQRTKSDKEQAEHRRKNREQFHERQRDLAERKKGTEAEGQDHGQPEPDVLANADSGQGLAHQ